MLSYPILTHNRGIILIGYHNNLAKLILHVANSGNGGLDWRKGFQPKPSEIKATGSLVGWLAGCRTDPRQRDGRNDRRKGHSCRSWSSEHRGTRQRRGEIPQGMNGCVICKG